MTHICSTVNYSTRCSLASFEIVSFQLNNNRRLKSINSIVLLSVLLNTNIAFFLPTYAMYFKSISSAFRSMLSISFFSTLVLFVLHFIYSLAIHCRAFSNVLCIVHKNNLFIDKASNIFFCFGSTYIFNNVHTLCRVSYESQAQCDSIQRNTLNFKVSFPTG